MNEKKREAILKIMSITAMFLCVYPITSIVRIFFFKEGRGFLDGLFYLAAIYGTFAAVTYIMRKDCTKKNAILAHLFLVIPILTSLVYFFYYGISSMIFGTFITAILCFLAIRSYFKKYHYLIDGVKIYVGIVMILLALTFSLYFEEFKYLKNQFYIFTFIYAFFVLIIKNQSNLDGIFSKRFDKASGIPKRMRSYNIRKILVFFLLIVVIYYFRDGLIVTLRTLGNLLTSVLKSLWNFIKIIMEKLYWLFDTEEINNSNSPEMGYGIIEGGGQNSILNTVFNVIFFLALAFAVYKISTLLIINEFIPFLKNAFKCIFQKIINLFQKVEYKEEKTYYYTDSIERVLPSDISKKSKEKKKMPDINKALRQVEKIQNPKEKIKHLYGFVLKYMYIKGMDIKKSYSTGEIYKKVREIEQLDKPFSEITSVYDRVKYGDKMPEINQVDETKSNTVKSINIIKKTK
ncbi:MAG TPA: hypothetical protein GX727_07325 [Clostridium sp.]|jgi:hypothetical protein|nr:hypothetical protein [Clostridium sp.]